MNNNIEYKDIKSLFRFYKKSELLKAFLIDTFVLIMIGGVFIVIFANIIPMIIRFLVPAITLLYVLLSLTAYYSKRFFVESLKNYKDVKYINYKQISLLLTIITSIIIMIVTIVIFTIIA